MSDAIAAAGNAMRRRQSDSGPIHDGAQRQETTRAEKRAHEEASAIQRWALSGAPAPFQPNLMDSPPPVGTVDPQLFERTRRHVLELRAQGVHVSRLKMTTTQLAQLIREQRATWVTPRCFVGRWMERYGLEGHKITQAGYYCMGVIIQLVRGGD